jgi:hypothetical protein
MFSDNYIVADKYDLNTKEMVSTFSRMPWRYTSLYDDTLLPVLDETIVEKINSFFRFRHLTSTEVLYDSKKILVIEHNGSEIKSFEAKNVLSYSVVSSHIRIWNNFIHSVQCPEIDLCKDKIDRLTDETDIRLTKIGSIKYNHDASFSGLTILDESYNLSEYSDNALLSKINEFPKNMNKHIKGIITLKPTINSLSYRLVFNYVKGLFNNPNKNNVIETIDMTPEYRNHYLNVLLDGDVLTEENVEFIKSVCVGKSQFDLEFVINDDGTLENVFFYHFRIKKFQDLTTS